MIQLQLFGVTDDRIFTTSSELIRAGLPENSKFSLVVIEENNLRHLCEKLLAHMFAGGGNDAVSSFLFTALFPSCNSLADAHELLDVIQLLQAHPWRKTFATCVLMAAFRWRPRQAMLETWRIDRIYFLGSLAGGRAAAFEKYKKLRKNDALTDDNTHAAVLALRHEYSKGWPLYFVVEPAFEVS